jgi:hypothetical protein
MKPSLIAKLAGVALLGLLAAGLSLDAGAAVEPVIRIDDVAAFYKIYDAAHGHPTADQLQHDYLDRGSDGLRRLEKLRNVTGTRIAEAIAGRPQMYTEARACMAVLPAVKTWVGAALGKLAGFYPQARFQPITIVVGRGKPTGVTDDKGVIIGLESLCAVKWMNPNLEDRFVHVIAHEYGHVEQAYAAPAMYGNDKPTVLEASIIEGAAEFTAELISGGVSDSFFAVTTKGREKEIESAFVPDEDKTDLSKWLYNGSLDKPGDLGYWVGYRIVKSYYQHATDKRRALAEIFAMTDAHAFLAKSGWQPGMTLQ